MTSINFIDIATINITCVHYCCLANRIAKSKPLNLPQNADFTEEKVEHYKTWKFAITYKMDKKVITFGNIELEKCKFRCYKNAVFKMMQLLVTS